MKHISLAAAAATLALTVTAPAASAAPAPAASGTITVSGAGAPATCGWSIPNAKVAWGYETEDGQQVLLFTSTTVTSTLYCPKGVSDFIYDTTRVLKNGYRQGTAKTSECTHAWCTSAVSTALWYCAKGVDCEGLYDGETSFTISLTAGRAWPYAPKGCKLSRDDEVIQCVILTNHPVYVPAVK